jgi:hypothetical protein
MSFKNFPLVSFAIFAIIGSVGCGSGDDPGMFDEEFHFSS